MKWTNPYQNTWQSECGGWRITNLPTGDRDHFVIHQAKGKGWEPVKVHHRMLYRKTLNAAKGYCYYQKGKET